MWSGPEASGFGSRAESFICCCASLSSGRRAYRCRPSAGWVPACGWDRTTGSGLARTRASGRGRGSAEGTQSESAGGAERAARRGSAKGWFSRPARWRWGPLPSPTERSSARTRSRRSRSRAPARTWGRQPVPGQPVPPTRFVRPRREAVSAPTRQSKPERSRTRRRGWSRRLEMNWRAHSRRRSCSERGPPPRSRSGPLFEQIFSAAWIRGDRRRLVPWRMPW